VVVWKKLDPTTAPQSTWRDESPRAAGGRWGDSAHCVRRDRPSPFQSART